MKKNKWLKAGSETKPKDTPPAGSKGPTAKSMRAKMYGSKT